jgi:hypothetical protein
VGIRETLNQNPMIAGGVAVVGLIVLVIFVIVQVSGGGGGGGEPPPQATKLFYTDDDGATFFVDVANKPVPFDHGGKQAIRARVYTCDGGKTKFVGFVERMTFDVRTRVLAAMGKPYEAAAFQEANAGGMELKKPKVKGPWVPQYSPQVRDVVQVTCPDGSRENIEPVEP